VTGMARNKRVGMRSAGVGLVAVLTWATSGIALGQTSNYLLNDIGNWFNAEAWDNGVPNGVGANAVFNQPVSNASNGTTTIINLGSNTVTLGSLTSNNDLTPEPDARYLRTQFNGGSFIFETTSGPATLNENLGASTEIENRMRFNVPVQLNSNLVVNSNHALNRNTNTEFAQLVSGSANKTITKEGFGNLQFAFTGNLSEGEGFLGNLIINNGGVRVINANTGTPPPNSQFSNAAGITVNAGGQFQLGNRITSFKLGAGAELKLNGTGKAAPAATTQNDGALRFENTASLGITCTFDSPINLQSASHIQVQAADVVGVLTQEVRGVGLLRKTGSGKLALNFANTYAGGTAVAAGELRVSGASAALGTGNVLVEGTANGTFLNIESGVVNAIANSATLSLAGGGTPDIADLGYVQLGDGINETIGGLILNGAVMAPGVYGSTTSAAPAENQFDEFFAGTGVVTVSASFLSADFNNSGSVDSTDFAIWKGGFGNATGQTKANGDANGDQAVSGADFLIWQQQFGSGPAAAAAGVPAPEPGSALLVLLAVPLAARLRRNA